MDAYWQARDKELASNPLEITLERDNFYSQPEWAVYRMRYDSLEGYRLFAWLSVPAATTGKKVPALIRMPDYASVHDIIYTSLRSDAVVMNATHRGQRNSDIPFQASYPGLLTLGIECPDTYLMRQVFVDGLRAVDALLGQEEVSIGPVALTGAGLGASLALIATACRPAVAAVAADTPLALGSPEALDGDTTYPLAELGDHLRIHPHSRADVVASLAPLNPVSIAPRVNAPVLLSLGRRDRGLCPLATGEGLAQRLPRCDVRVYDGGSEGGGHEHGLVRTQWLREQLGIG